jgi:hypothetical protein
MHTKLHDDTFRHSSNIKVILLIISQVALLLVLKGGIFKDAIEIVPGDMIHVPSFLKIGAGLRNMYVSRGYTYGSTERERADAIGLFCFS